MKTYEHANQSTIDTRPKMPYLANVPHLVARSNIVHWRDRLSIGLILLPCFICITSCDGPGKAEQDTFANLSQPITPRSTGPGNTGSNANRFNEASGVNAEINAANQERPAAVVLGKRVNWGPLRSRLAEAAGAVVLEELALDAAIDAEMLRQGLSITDADIKAEDVLITRAVIADAKMTPDQAQRAISDLRRSEGLGPNRYADLLRRNARLRAIARASMPERVAVTDAEAKQALELAQIPRARARIIVVDSDRAAAMVRSQIVARVATGELMATAFANAAIVESRDPSARNAGLLEDVSPADPVLPSEVRTALRTLEIGTISDVLAMNTRYGLVLVESRSSAPLVGVPVDLASVRERVRTRKERGAMDDIASRLIQNARVTIYDESLRWSWERANEAAR